MTKNAEKTMVQVSKDIKAQIKKYAKKNGILMYTAVNNAIKYFLLTKDK